MSLPSQQRRGPASGRTSSSGRRGRRRQGLPGPVKLLAAGATLVLVLWVGWSFLGPAPMHAGEPDTGTDAASIQATTENGSSANDDRYDASGDPAMAAILGTDQGTETDEVTKRDNGLLTASLPSSNQTQPPVAAEPVRDQPLPDPNPVEIDTVQRRGRDAGTEPLENGAGEAQRLVASGRLPAAEAALLDADVLIAENRPVDARSQLNVALLSDSTDNAGRALLRERLALLNETLLFGPVAHADDPMTELYEVAPNDSLARIASRRELATHWKLIARVNGLADPSRIRLGQTLKLVRGPFHAVVDKSDFRLDIYHGPPDSPTSWTYIRSFQVGLGERDGTPAGSFVISSNKLENPGWTNPRNPAERYGPDDPENPIGNYWVGLTGLGASAGLSGYGLHGTIEPESIGRSMSMGCVRLVDTDIAIVYELLEEHISVVHIVE